MNATYDYMSKLTKEQMLDIVKRLIGPPSRKLKGEEKRQFLQKLNQFNPTSCSNNQRTLTYVYHINEKRYEVTYGLEDGTLVQEYELD